MTFKERYTIRPATIADAPILPAIERSAALLFGEVPGQENRASNAVIDQVAHSRWMSEGRYLIAEWGLGLCVGFLAARPCEENLLILQLSVRRAFQKRGIARSLMARCLSDARKNLCPEVWLEADPSISWHGSFCGSLGFHPKAKSEVSTAVRSKSIEDPRRSSADQRESFWMVRYLPTSAEMLVNRPANVPRFKGQ